LAQLVRSFDLHFDNQIAALIRLVHSLSPHAESLSRCSALRNLDENLLPIERRHADLRPKRRLRDVDRNRRDDIQAFTLVELVSQNRERDKQVAGRSVARSFSSLTLEPDFRACIDPGRNGDEDLLSRADFTCTVASWRGL